MVVVGTKDVLDDFVAVLAAMTAPEVRMVCCLSVCEFHHFAMSIGNQSICSNMLMFGMFPFLLNVLTEFE